MKTKNISLVEDDLTIASGLLYALEQEGYTATHCKNVNEAKSAAANDVSILRFLIYSCREVNENAVLCLDDSLYQQSVSLFADFVNGVESLFKQWRYRCNAFIPDFDETVI